jgi:hypothetical protein
MQAPPGLQTTPARHGMPPSAHATAMQGCMHPLFQAPLCMGSNGRLLTLSLAGQAPAMWRLHLGSEVHTVSCLCLLMMLRIHVGRIHTVQSAVAWQLTFRGASQAAVVPACRLLSWVELRGGCLKCWVGGSTWICAGRDCRWGRPVHNCQNAPRPPAQDSRHAPILHGPHPNLKTRRPNQHTHTNVRSLSSVGQKRGRHAHAAHQGTGGAERARLPFRSPAV